MNKRKGLTDAKIYEDTDSSIMDTFNCGICVSTLDLQHMGKTTHWEICSHSDIYDLLVIYGLKLFSSLHLFHVDYKSKHRILVKRNRTKHSMRHLQCSQQLSTQC